MPRLAPVTQEPAPLRRKITAALRQAIEAGTIKLGERLIEKNLCRELDVSRTSLREAIRELAAEGLLATIPAGGVIVAQITRQEAENIYRIRGAIEALVAEQFAETASDAARAALRKAAENLELTYRSAEIGRILEAKRIFYDCLCAGAGNQTALDILSRLNSRISQLRILSLAQPGRFEASIAEVWELVEAIEARAPAAAYKAATRHVANAAGAFASMDREAAIAPVSISNLRD